jgi:hypothetical protein
MTAKYDIIGINYAELRKPDRRIALIIESALGPAQTVLNVGAGAGSYEPTDRSVTAVEPSREMIRKRSPSAAEVIQASAEELPFDDKSFDASMAILTMVGLCADHTGDDPARLQRRTPLCLLASACSLSRSVHSIRQFVLLGYQQRRTSIAESEARS